MPIHLALKFAYSGAQALPKDRSRPLQLAPRQLDRRHQVDHPILGRHLLPILAEEIRQVKARESLSVLDQFAQLGRDFRADVTHQALGYLSAIRRRFSSVR